MSTDKLNLGTSEASEWPKTGRRRGRRAGSSVPSSKETDVVCDGLCGLTRRGAPVGIAFVVVTPVQPAMDESFRDKNTSYSEFTPVIPRRKRRNKSHQVRPPLSVLLQRTRDEISNDIWFSQCQSIIKESLESFPNKSSSLSILCLGLGSPSASTVSRTQLAFLMELCSALDIDHAKVSIYDPIFSNEDTELFQQLQFQILTENKNGEYPLQRPTICYMPHCDMELYDNLLRVNHSRDQLLTPILLANHLMDYLDNNSHDKLRDRVPYLFKIAPMLQSRSLPSSTAWPAAFNNTSIQYLRPLDLH